MLPPESEQRRVLGGKTIQELIDSDVKMGEINRTFKAIDDEIKRLKRPKN